MTTNGSIGRGPTQRDDVVVIGAGPSGLAARRALFAAGYRVRVLERGEGIGTSWRGHYDSLRLNSGRLISSLPGLPMPRHYGRWVGRDDFLEYLGHYAGLTDGDIDFGVNVRRLDRVDDGWVIRTNGPTYEATAVVVATGIYRVPFWPEWATKGGFNFKVVHASEYLNATPYRNLDALVVGTGPSGNDIAVDLARGGARRVRMSVRTPPILVPRRTLGFSSAVITHITKHYIPVPPALFDWTSLLLYRLHFPKARKHFGAPPAGILAALAERGHGFALEAGVLSALEKGIVSVVPAVESLVGDDVVLVDGQRIQPDLVVLATGQRTGLAPLVGHLGVLGPDERPLAHGGKTVAGVPGLYFLGYRLPGGQLSDMRVDAPAVAQDLLRCARHNRRSLEARRPTSSEPTSADLPS